MCPQPYVFRMMGHVSMYIRVGKNAHNALKCAQDTIAAGHSWFSLCALSAILSISPGRLCAFCAHSRAQFAHRRKIARKRELDPPSGTYKALPLARIGQDQIPLATRHDCDEPPAVHCPWPG